jgi:hypothetical protein
MGSAYVPLDIDQGEDWTASIIYSDDFDNPYNVIAPCRMDIKSKQGATQLSLSTPDAPLPDGEIPEIMLSSDIGLIQIHIEDTTTAALIPGVYKYDLFVTINDGNDYAGNQVQRLIHGEVTVNQRVTVL